MERTIGSALLGKIPDATMDDALVDLLRAERAYRARGRLCRETWLTIAWCYQRKGDHAMARQYAQEAAAQPVRTAFDRLDQRKLELLLQQLS